METEIVAAARRYARARAKLDAMLDDAAPAAGEQMDTCITEFRASHDALLALVAEPGEKGETDRVTALRERVAALEGAHPQAAVREFHEAFGAPLGGSWANKDRRRLRRRLINEEFEEYLMAEDDNEEHSTLDALVDMVYVIIGAALEYGWDFTGAFAAVHAANMAKLGPDGKPIIREDGKVLKPEGWTAADLTPFLQAVQPSDATTPTPTERTRDGG